MAQDAGGNLSRVKVRNNTTGIEGQDFGLSGTSAPFRIEDVTLAVGDNNIRVTAFDDAGNSSNRDLVVQRLGESPGAVLIVAGRNETASLQTNIYNSTNRAYRIFKSAGYSDDDIYYLAAVEQKPDGDVNRVDDTASPAALESAITEWARSRVGFGQPFTIYMMDHGFADRYCVDGCAVGGHVTPAQLNQWLETLESTTGVNQVNIIIEACQSGSFLDRFNGTVQDIQNSLSRQNRVVITSTGRENNAYASAQGAYFSDAFFSCLADSDNLKACFDQGKAAVTVTGVDQTPWMDDNGDGLHNSSDGSVAQGRFVTRFFSAVRPQITLGQVERNGSSGTLTADVTPGAEAVEIVWAAIYPPNFEEPDDVTLNLQVPTVRLEPDASAPNRYSFTYVNGFTEVGDYRIVFYAQDRLGIHAQPRLPGDTPVATQNTLFLPFVAR
ncbi:MAG: C13 family peptidase [Caldilineaceae bacterium]